MNGGSAPPRATPAVTLDRWHRLAAELQELATSTTAAEFDDARERVGVLVVREALALNVSTELRAVSP